nr:PREDICTED: C-type lectin domain family 4 member D isoform X6 [Equus przewalskii]XP_008541014.1 PREDICTED: C-type lectin domain family 4 member D isoform X6 [Equus przewalskii]
MLGNTNTLTGKNKHSHVLRNILWGKKLRSFWSSQPLDNKRVNTQWGKKNLKINFNSSLYFLTKSAYFPLALSTLEGVCHSQWIPWVIAIVFIPVLSVCFITSCLVTHRNFVHCKRSMRVFQLPEHPKKLTCIREKSELKAPGTVVLLAGDPSSPTAAFLLMTTRHGPRVTGTVQGWGLIWLLSARKLSRTLFFNFWIDDFHISWDLRMRTLKASGTGWTRHHLTHI